MIHKETREKTKMEVVDDSDSLKSLKHIDEIASREDIDVLHSLTQFFPSPPTKLEKLKIKFPSILWISFVATLAFVIIFSGTGFLNKRITQPLLLLGAKSGSYFLIVILFYILSSVLK